MNAEDFHAGLSMRASTRDWTKACPDFRLLGGCSLGPDGVMKLTAGRFPEFRSARRASASASSAARAWSPRPTRRAPRVAGAEALRCPGKVVGTLRVPSPATAPAR